MNANWINNIKELEYKNTYFFYDGYSGRLFYSNIEENLLLKQIRYYHAINDPINFNAFKKEKRDEIDNLFKKINTAYEEDGLTKSLLEKGLEENANAGLNSLWINVVHTCNLACKYCFVNKGKYDNSGEIMTLQVAEAEVEEWLKNLDEKQKVFNVIFFGGEPLLNLEVIKYIVHKVNMRMDELKSQCIYYLTTNGTIINDEVIELLNNNDFVFSISIDGLEFIHNYNRIFLNGKGSYYKVMDNSKKLLEIQPKTIINMVVRKEAIPLISESVKFLWEKGFKSVKVALSLEEEVEFTIEDIFEYRDQMEKLANITYENILRGNDCVLENVINVFTDLSKRSNCGNCALYMNRLSVVDPNGRKYKCYKEISDSEHQEYSHIFIEECTNCWAVALCGEGCPLDHKLYTKDFYKRDKMLCISQKAVYDIAIKLYIKFFECGSEQLKRYFLWRHTNG